MMTERPPPARVCSTVVRVPLPFETSVFGYSLCGWNGRWKPGPAGRGGERVSKKRAASSEGFDSDEDESSWPAAAHCGLSLPSRESPSASPIAVPSSPDSVLAAPLPKRGGGGSEHRGGAATRRAAHEEAVAHSGGEGGLLDILYAAATSVGTMDGGDVCGHHGVEAGEGGSVDRVEGGSTPSRPPSTAQLSHGAVHVEDHSAGAKRQRCCSPPLVEREVVVAAAATTTMLAAYASVFQPTPVPPQCRGEEVTPKREVSDLCPQDATIASMACAAGADAAAVGSWASTRAAGRRPPDVSRHRAGSIASICCSPYLAPIVPSHVFASPLLSAAARGGARDPAAAAAAAAATVEGEAASAWGCAVPAPFASLFLEPPAAL